MTKVTVEDFLSGFSLDYTSLNGHAVTATYLYNSDLGINSVKICPKGQRRALSNVIMTKDQARDFYYCATAIIETA